MNLKSKTFEILFKNPALIGYLVKKFNDMYSDNQMGKTIVQKLMYLLTRRGTTDFAYSLYHYGPYSSKVSAELDFAKNLGLVDINWKDEKGFFIKPTKKIDEFESLLGEEDKKSIDEIVNKFGGFNAKDLSIVATAFYVMDNFDVSKNIVIDVVWGLKPKYKTHKIKTLLERAGVI